MDPLSPEQAARLGNFPETQWFIENVADGRLDRIPELLLSMVDYVDINTPKAAALGRLEDSIKKQIRETSNVSVDDLPDFKYT